LHVNINQNHKQQTGACNPNKKGSFFKKI